MKTVLTIAMVVVSLNVLQADPIWKSGRLTVMGESFSVGLSIDNTLLQHALLQQ